MAGGSYRGTAAPWRWAASRVGHQGWPEVLEPGWDSLQHQEGEAMAAADEISSGWGKGGYS